MLRTGCTSSSISRACPDSICFRPAPRSRSASRSRRCSTRPRCDNWLVISNYCASNCAGENAVIKTTFATLDNLLLELGFRHSPAPGRHLLYEHPEADVFIALRPYQPDERVGAASLAYVRHTLDTWGILE